MTPILRRMAQSPFQFVATGLAIPVGLCAIVLGGQVSTAMSRVLGAHFDVVRLWGALLVVGGAMAVYGRYGRRPGLERAGLQTLGPAYLLYAISVVLGLGLGGLVAGPMFTGLGIACFVRVRGSMRDQGARAAADRQLRPVDPPT